MTIDNAVFDAEALSEASDAPTPRHWTDRLDRRLLTALTVIGLGVPVAAYLWFVAHYSLNTVVGDQWDDVTLIHNSYLHGFDLSAAWAQHNENRILFPNLIVLLLSRTTHYNVRIEEYLGAVFLLASLALLIATHRRRTALPLLYYCPVAILMLSFVQWSNTTWGFQMAWFLVLLTMAATLYLLDAPDLTRTGFVCAVATAIVASYSSIQGLLIWPVGLLLLYQRRRRWYFAATWAGTGLVVAAIYFHNFRFQNTSLNNSIIRHYPLRAVKSYLFSLGDVLGFPISLRGTANPFIVPLGGVIFALAVLALIFYGLGRDTRSGRPIGIALISIGLLFDAMITEGRIFFGYAAAGASRYTTYDLLVPVGIYLVFVERPRATTVEAASERPFLRRWDAITSSLRRSSDRWLLFAGRVIIIGAIAVQLAYGVPNGLRNARANYVYQARGAQVMRNIRHEPALFIVYYLDPFDSAPYLRRQVGVLRRYQLSLFGPGSRSLAPPPGGPSPATSTGAG